MDLKNETRKEEMDEDFDFDWDDIPYYDLTFAKGIFEIVNSLIDRNHINENFKSKSSLKYHFEKYCLGNGNKASETSHVYYDFKEINDYKEHASRIISNLNNPNTLIISSLGNKELIKERFNEFFKGNRFLLFDCFCGFNNNCKPLFILLHSYAMDVTTNYNGNTVDFCICSGGAVRAIYPIDSNCLIAKLNSFVG